MNRKMRILPRIFLCTLCVLLSGCAPLQEKIREYSRDKEQCSLNVENVAQFICKSENYTILEETVAKENLGNWIGCIRKLATVDDSGKILTQEDLEQTDIQTLTYLAGSVPENVFMVSFLNVYASPDKENCLFVDVNGGYHKAVLSKNVTEKDEIFDFKAAAQMVSGGFKINPEDATQLIHDGAVYQVTSEIISNEELGNYLDILSENVTFDVDTKKALSKEELKKIDWYGTEKKQREKWIYTDIYEIFGRDPQEAIAVKVNNQYHIAEKQ